MAELQSFSTPAGVDVLFQVEESGGGSPDLADAMRAVSAIASLLVQEIASMPADNAPEEIEVGFGLVAVAAGQLAVTRGTESANLRLTLRFSGDAGRTNELIPDEI